MNLPDTAILPVYRSGSSGTTMLFTTYLTRASEAWAAGPRAGTTVQWLAGVGAAVGGRDALVAKMQGTPGAISFGGPALVKETKFASVSLRNRAGEFVKANAAKQQSADRPTDGGGARR